MREILLATGNPGKAREMREILTGQALAGEPPVARESTLADKPPVAQEPSPDSTPAAAENVIWRYLSEFDGRKWPEPVEDGETFMANAEIKARHYARLSGMWTIADDSGLVVDALDGEPGVRSARYAGEPRSDQANNALLIRNLAGIPEEKRTARFRCAVVLAGVQDPAGGAGTRQSAQTGEIPAPQSGMPSSQIRVLACAEGTVEGRIVDEPRGANGFGYDPHFWVPELGMTTAEMASDRKHAISHRGQALRRLRERLSGLIAGGSQPDKAR
jgi:XTP/dITP diphosphohydrolase